MPTLRDFVSVAALVSATAATVSPIFLSMALGPVPVPPPAPPAHHLHLGVVAVVVDDAAHARHRHEPVDIKGSQVQN